MSIQQLEIHFVITGVPSEEQLCLERELSPYAQPSISYNNWMSAEKLSSSVAIKRICLIIAWLYLPKCCSPQPQGRESWQLPSQSTSRSYRNVLVPLHILPTVPEPAPSLGKKSSSSPSTLRVFLTGVSRAFYQVCNLLPTFHALHYIHNPLEKEVAFFTSGVQSEPHWLSRRGEMWWIHLGLYCPCTAELL